MDLTLLAILLSFMATVTGHTLPVEIMTVSSATVPAHDGGDDSSTDEAVTFVTTAENSILSSHNTDCKCVPYFLCNTEDVRNTTNNPGPEDIKEKKCEKSLEVLCCKSAMDVLETKPTTERDTSVSHHTSDTSSITPLPDWNSRINSSTNTTPVNIPETTTSSSNEHDCKCVAYYECADGDLLNSEESLIDLPNIKDESCENYLHVCCKSVVKSVPEPNTTTTQVSLSTTTSRPLTSLHSCTQPLLNDSLPIRNVDYDGKAQFGEFPWMVALLQGDVEGKDVYLCGGSLIHPRVVLTGAHCVQGKKNLLIRAGEWDTQSELELYPTQNRNVSEVIIHSEFNNASLFNDMALLILDSPVEINKEEGHVGLVCLPEENEDFSGRDCVASGWGKSISGNEEPNSAILKKVDMPIVPRQACQEALRKTKLGSRFKLHSSFICAGGVPGKDTCKGDGGSPLVCPSKMDPNVFVQVGIVAWGISCGTEAPGTYVNVPAFGPWIYSQLQNHGIS